MSPIADGLVGAMRAVTWAALFYVLHAWPLAMVAGIPTSVRMIAAVRGPSSSTTKLSGSLEMFSPLVRLVLLVVAATIDLAPDQAWWSNLWPGIWMPAGYGGSAEAFARRTVTRI